MDAISCKTPFIKRRYGFDFYLFNDIKMEEWLVVVDFQ